MEWVETTGVSVADAKERALDVLGVSWDDAEFEIIEEPKTGLFGRMKTEARVRARVLPRKPRAKQVPRRDRDRSSSRTRRDTRETREPTNRNRNRAPRESRERQPQGGDRMERQEAPREPRPEVIVPMAEQAKVATEFLEGFVTVMGVDAQVKSQEVAEEILELSLEGSGLGLLIGPRGQTMTALQEFARIVVQRRTGATNGRIIVDVAGYRQRRKEALSEFVRSVAADVISSGQAKVLEPMNPADRKIVHDAVNEIEGVTTSSEGEEPRRRVVLSPA